MDVFLRNTLPGLQKFTYRFVILSNIGTCCCKVHVCTSFHWRNKCNNKSNHDHDGSIVKRYNENFMLRCYVSRGKNLKDNYHKKGPVPS